MHKGIFITGTGTDIGKTYVTALLVKKMRQLGLNTGYYKAAISGAPTVSASDAGYVNRIAQINQDESTLVSYLYQDAVSPHLAAQIEGNPVEKERVLIDYNTVANTYDYVVMEGSGGIVCPIRYDATAKYLLEDIIKWLDLPVLIIASSQLGTINNTVLTVEYLQQRNISIKGIIINNYTDSTMERDNCTMIQELTRVPIIALVKPNETDLDIKKSDLEAIFE